MLAGVKFIPRDQLDEEKNEKGKKKSNSSKDKRRKKKQHYSSSEDDLEKIKKMSKKKQKWYSSEEESDDSCYSSESDSNSDQGTRRDRGKKKKSKRRRDRSDEETKTKSRGRRKRSSSEYGSSDSDGDSMKNTELDRKEIGLEWMLRPQEKIDTKPSSTNDNSLEEAPAREEKVNPRELNPYLRNSGSGYPDDVGSAKNSDNKLLSSSVVGDGGASWRLKALKRAQEQAAREGRKLDEVVEERWSSLGQLAVSAASRMAAPPRAHLHAIKQRKNGPIEGQKTIENETERDIRNIEKKAGRDYLHGVSSRHHEMRAPKVHEGLSWGRRKSQNMSSMNNTGVVSDAASTMNKFTDDGNFMQQFLKKSDVPSASIGSSSKDERNADSNLIIPENNKHNAENALLVEGRSANQLAAKALQLRLKGKHDEAEKLMKEAENLRAKQGAGDDTIQPQNQGSTRRYVMQDASYQQKKRADDTDMHLAQRIVQNKLYSVSGQADEEYDFDEGPRKKSRKRGGHDDNKASQTIGKRLLTQQERCLFCFENPERPKHLVVSIANFTYLMLPKWQPVVPGHCCILTMQHESATRNVDNNVWEEIRNFKKCLIMMFAKQEKEMVFLETVMGLAQQRHHCLIECIPLPQEIAKQAPLYFKKAIDEAEDEWSQHNAKRLIDTSEKGLRGSIPKNFPYFHVEFGLSRGFVHVIDDEKQFKSSLGLNVIRGMLRLPEEDMHRRRKYDSVAAQRQAVLSFTEDWKKFDWTNQLE